MVWLGSAVAWGQDSSAAQAAAEIARRVEAFERTHNARVGVFVRDLRTGRTLLEHRSREAMIPASNQKILASAFALVRLGAKGTFTTSVFAAGRDVVVTGQFDPLLGDPVLARQNQRSIYEPLDRWVAAVRETLGETIPGDLILASQSDVASLHPPSWPRYHFDRWYGAPVADLNFHDNCFDVSFVADGETIRPVVAPAGRFLRVVDELRRQPKGRHLWRLVESPDGGTLTLMGQIQGPASDPLSVPMRDPRVTLGRVLADRLQQGGVRIAGRLRVLPAGQVSLDSARLLAKMETPLAAVMSRSNKRSLNLAAECMMLRAGDGTWTGSARQMRETLIERFALDAQTLAVHDGSGLSRENRVSSQGLVKLLEALLRLEGGEMFLDSLPRSGVDGSLHRRLREAPYRGRVAAKTGNITGVSTLSGYILDAGGDEKKPVLAFSILANDLRGRAAGLAKPFQDQICRDLLNAAAP